MKSIKYTITILYTLSCLILGCTKINKNSNHSKKKLYESVQKKLNNANYQQAIKEMQSINKNYSLCSSCLKQIQLNLIYAYYKSSDLISMIHTIDYFLLIYPTDPNIDYVLYMKGLANMSLFENNLQKFFQINTSEHDITYANYAFNDFKKLIWLYPYSKYSTDAQKRLIYLKNKIADHELSIIKFYFKHKAYVPVIHRVEDMLIYFQDTIATYESLSYMYTSYKKLKLKEEAKNTLKLINKNKTR